VAGRIDAEFADGREQRLKNIDRPMRVYRLPDPAAKTVPPTSAQFPRHISQLRQRPQSSPDRPGDPRPRHEVVIPSKSGSPREGSSDAVRGGSDALFLRQTCEQSLKNLGVETLDVFCMSRVDPNLPIEESVGGMAELVKEAQDTFHLALSVRLSRSGAAVPCPLSDRTNALNERMRRDAGS
jgi:hypothetical protein